MPLFAGIVLAERIERAEAQLMAGVSVAARRRGAGTAGFVLPIAGGVASFAEEGSPFNKVAGLGFGGVPDSAALGEIEQAFAACGSPVQIELAHLADPAIGALLTGRGYRLVSFENVLGRALEGRPERVTPPGVEVRPSGEDELEAWLGVVVDASLHSDAQGVGGFNRSSQHLDHGGVRWDAVGSNCRTRRRVHVGSGRRIGRCGRRCGHQVGLSRLVRCSGSSGGSSLAG